MKYAQTILRSTVDHRKTGTFLYIESGHYRYRFSADILDAGAGDVVYVPKGASYTYEILGGAAYCMQFEFDLYEEDSGESVVFSERPKIVIRNASFEVKKAFDSVVSAILFDEGDLRRTGNMLLFLAACAEEDGKEPLSGPTMRIQPALEYIRRCFTSKIRISRLAEMCFLSETQFRRLFRESMGISAIGYKNRLVIDAAKKMLRTGNAGIGEIADGLGFPSVYAFSQTFRKYTGSSPTEYRNGGSE